MSTPHKQTLHYSMVIEWSQENDTFMVYIPEFPGNYTHGDTYEEAVRQAEDLIESLIMWTQQDGKPLPRPRAFALP